MSKLLTSALAMVIIAAAAPSPIAAAELAAPARVVHWRHHPHGYWVCCRLRVKYVYHRQLESTYGTGFDPRNYDTTEPHYYYGRLHAYPRYWVEIDPVPAQ